MEFFNDVGSDPLKPSLFELVAQEQLRDLLQPALKYVLAVFAQRYPRYLLRVVNRHEEFYAAIMFFVERHYLRKHNATFSENFYGLKRRRRPFIETERAQAAVGGIPAAEALRPQEIWRSLLFSVGVPYLRAKAQDYYEELGGGVPVDIDDGQDARLRVLTDPSFRGICRRTMKRVYPWLNTTFELWLLVCNIAYLFDQTPFYRPWLSWMGVDLRRLGVEDFRAVAATAKKQPTPSPLAWIRRMLFSSPQVLFDSLRLLLPTAIFFIKFLEWWYSPNSPARSLSTSPLGPAVPPPRMLPPHPQGIPFDPQSYGKCPICKGPIKNATALPSGYVFCYRCAYEQVEKDGMCPITRLPARIWQLKKIISFPTSLDAPPCFKIRYLIPSALESLPLIIQYYEGAAFLSALVAALIPYQFGKHIQAQQVPGWSAYYLDYKFLKKIISSLTANRPASEAAALALGLRPADSADSTSSTVLQAPDVPPLFSGAGDDDRSPDFRAHKAAFFFKLERELEKINEFYLQKEAELKLRLETLLSKRRAAAMRGFPDTVDDTTRNNVEWSAVEEGFRHLERDLGKLQQFVEINATGFRKILKKFDKRSTSTTKELYLARQVDVQPVFNRQLISELSDTVAACLLDLTDLSSGLRFEGSAATDILAQQIMNERPQHMGPFHDLENNLRKAVAAADFTAINNCIHYSEVLAQQGLGGKTNVTRILWNAIIEAPTNLADTIMASVSTPFDFQFIDDINGRTCLHGAAIAGTLRLAQMCIEKGVDVGKLDSYGRTALHYAAMNGHDTICQLLLQTNLSPEILDMDNYSALVYATLKGSVDCVRVLLDQGRVPIQLAAGDLIPLSLASKSGHVQVVTLLLERGARCFPNSNGEYPMHLAAREGHADVCRLLLHRDGWDTPDKYHEWTPLFHAARYGRGDCVRILLDAGARVRATDELGHLAVYYAIWYGHHNCLSPLLNATPPLVTVDPVKAAKDSPLSDMGMTESEIDLIPSLSLPPPIMPHRVYGHNYLDKNHLVQVTIGSTRSEQPGVRLHHRLISPAFRNDMLMASTPLKVVITSSQDVNSGPYSIPLPQRDTKGTYTFQASSLDNLSLVFSIYPNFGTKTIGRAVALPSLFKDFEKGRPFVLPILDTRLHVIGEVDFEVNIVTPFDGVTLEVGGDVETYWKSLAMPLATVPHRGPSRWPHRSSLIGSAHTSPSQTSSHSVPSNTSQASTISSLRGSYLHLVIQVTRDLHPVVYADWLLPQLNFDMTVSDVTLAQFEALALSAGRNLDTQTDNWANAVSTSMVSLAQLLTILPNVLGVSLELAYPQRAVRAQSSAYRLQLNDFVDSVLKTIYHASGPLARRRIVFTSFSPDVCSAVNWKQPNYPVFFASQCGNKEPHVRHLPFTGEDQEDGRTTSVGAAVEFARANNLLGVFVDADLLMQVPSLIDGIRNAGLLIGINGASDSSEPLTSASPIEGTPVDAFVRDGMVFYVDHSMRELI
ncbi:cyclin-dependent protein kinase inhibitor [Roridomyces roridus]|uniref:Peroxisome assembly protein 12 n=1 Tax=Roridomyces roridus TaxID=1738132 RepID=A0AAD7C407_9AGAR|nr:cyclin-dependent protein kinase inhibitor [Roridomyces roridus]